MFETGKIYIRRAIHKQYGGNPQGGIANCADHPIILIFTGPSGTQHGYEDGWDASGFFHYTGEGQEGDMQFIRGNRSLLEHQANEKSVYLFESAGRGSCKFISQLELTAYYLFQTPDRTNHMRQGIKFVFGRCTSEGVPEKIVNVVNFKVPVVTERTSIVLSRVGQDLYRKFLLMQWNGRCAVTNVDLQEILVASHIVPWKKSTDKERLDVNNGLLLTPMLDKLFDKYLISFSDKGRIIISKRISKEQRQAIGLHVDQRLRHVTPEMKKYLEIHRQKFNENN
jgi:hypothetical protein